MTTVGDISQIACVSSMVLEKVEGWQFKKHKLFI